MTNESTSIPYQSELLTLITKKATLEHFSTVSELKSYAFRFLKPSRAAHVEGCLETAQYYAKLHQADCEALQRAAILHDCTKLFSYEAQLILAEKYGILLSGADLESPQVIHAITGAGAAAFHFGETPEICRMIRYHTTGSPNMSLEDMLLYLADMLEPSRTFPGVEELRRIAEKSPVEAYRSALHHTIHHLRTNHLPVHPDTLSALEAIRK